MATVKFALKTIERYARGADRRCPHCEGKRTAQIHRKKVILQLRRCEDCGLMFRHPKDDAVTNLKFYQEDYDEGVTSELPDDAALAAMLTSRFAGTQKDFSARIALMRLFAPKGRMLDYGASWGYGAWQLAQAGFDVTGFEISQPRARFATQKLGVRMLTTLAEFAAAPDASFDAIFANHVIEHLPSVSPTFREFARLLAPGGHLFVFVPNCTGSEEEKTFAWKQSWAIGEKHTIAYDDRFFVNNLPAYGFDVRCFNDPYDGLMAGGDAFARPNAPVSASAVELFVLARRIR